MYNLYVITVFTVGVIITIGSEDLTLANALTDYSYMYIKNTYSAYYNGIRRIARCLTGLGPSGNSNGELGGLYFNGNRIMPNQGCVHPRSANHYNLPGVINIRQCRGFSTVDEGIYTCTIRNSSMMDQSIRLGVYFPGRSKSLS